MSRNQLYMLVVTLALFAIAVFAEPLPESASEPESEPDAESNSEPEPGASSEPENSASMGHGHILMAFISFVAYVLPRRFCLVGANRNCTTVSIAVQSIYMDDGVRNQATECFP